MATATGKTFKCIEAIGRSGMGLTVSEVATTTDLSWPAANRLLDALASEGVVVKDVISKRFRLSLRFCEWSNLAAQSLTPINIARKELVKLCMETGQQFNLVVMEDLDAVILERCELVDGVPVNRFVPARRIWYETATGKAIVAFASKETRALVLERTYLLQDLALPERGVLEAELDEVRQLGLAKSTDLRPAGVVGVVVPILDKNGTAIAAVGSFLSSEELDGETGQLLLTRLKSAAGLISHYLGHDGEYPASQLSISPVLS